MKLKLVSATLIAVVLSAIAMSAAFPCAHEARVGDLSRSCPARRAGLLPMDTIESVDERAVTSWEQAEAEITSRAGRKVKLTVVRAGSAGPVTLELEVPAGGWRDTGLSPYWERAVIALTAGSPLRRYGAESGDEVIQLESVTIVSLAQLRAELQAHPADRPLNLVLRRGDERLSLGVAPLGAPYRLDTLGMESATTVIASVMNGGPGERLGLKAGDRIVLLQGQATREGVDQRRFLADVRAEKKIRATVVRGDQLAMLETSDSGDRMKLDAEGDGLSAALSALQVRPAQSLSRGHHITGLCWCSWLESLHVATIVHRLGGALFGSLGQQ